MTTKRAPFIDIFRGVVIADMMLMHLDNYFPQGAQLVLGALDFAIEGFVFLAGYIIGYHYLEKFRTDPEAISRRLIARAGKLVLVQYILILTVSVPAYTILERWSVSETLAFAKSSLLFLNQVPVIHILPTFIPYLLVSPLILFLQVRNKDAWLLALSLTVFAIGQIDPYLLSLGEDPVFPVLLWQVYFVAGCAVGKAVSRGWRVDPIKLLILSACTLAACFLLRYGGFLDLVRQFKADYDLYPRKFPLNWLGLLYGASLLAFCSACCQCALSRFPNHGSVWEPIAVLGRNSLLVFALHVYVIYLAKILGALDAGRWLQYIVVVAGLLALYQVVRRIDRRLYGERFGRAYRWLFA